MTGETAEDPWAGFTGQSAEDAADAELIDPILKALGESRARFGDMEQRALAAEAVVELVVTAMDDNGSYCECGHLGLPPRLESALREPSAVLPALKREWQAEALEEAEQITLRTATVTRLTDPDDTAFAADARMRLIAERLRTRAAELRNGGNTEGTDNA